MIFANATGTSLAQFFHKLWSIRIKYLALTILSLVIFATTVAYIQARDSFKESKKNVYESSLAFSNLSVKQLGDLYLDYYNSGYLTFANQSSEILKLNRNITQVQIINFSGEILYDSQQTKAGTLTAPDLSASQIKDSKILDKLETSESVLFSDKNGDVTQILVPYLSTIGQRPFSILYTISYTQADIIAQNTLRSIILTTLVITLLVAFTTIIAINLSFLGPLTKVIDGAKRITAGQLNYQIPVKRRDEIGDLAEAVNFMAAALRKDIEDLKSLDKLKDEFIIIASHNLRTPITAIRGYLSFLKEDLVKIAKKDREYLTNASLATEKLSNLVEELLNIVNIKSGQNPFHKTAVQIEWLINSVIKNLSYLSDKKGIKVLTSIGTLPPVFVDQQSITSVLENTLDNAIKFSEDKGKIEIKAIFNQGEILVSVKDYGKGMSPDQLIKLFQKFQRGEDLLTYNYEGEGLGLYLNHLIIQAHGGRIWAESELHKGTTIYFTLPIASS